MLWVSDTLGTNNKPSVTGFNARVTPDGLLVEALLITRGAPTGTCTGVLLHSESEREQLSVNIPEELLPKSSYVVHPNPNTPEELVTIVNNQYFMLMEVNK